MSTRLASLLLCTGLIAPALQAGIIHIPADRDTTLIEDPDGAYANGSGPAFFTGRTGQAENGIRRALVRFDVAAALPANAIIDRVFLSLHLNKAQPGQSSISLHRLLDDWGEGTSFSAGGSGAPAEPGDATWLHTFHDYRYWVQAGGHFIPHASASQTVEGTGFYTWQNSVHLANDVRLWLQAPRQNFGWLLMGDESSPQTVQRFDSREGLEADRRPVLTVEYHLPGE